ncbi:MAG: ubiquitin-like protein Pup [Candidatus Aenigmarchaeota archaeon]|nr:ubiquitin-like protein Pup [Candidatus Aenigmarchaeota archaeon]
MNKKIFAIVLVLLAFTVIISGCIGQSTQPAETAKTEIKSEQQVAQAVSNISQDVQDVSSVLDEIDKTLSS